MQADHSFTIDPKSEIPVWVQVKQRLTYLIVSGAYQAGDQLPTVRELALDLGINYHTVNKVYQRLEGDGLVEIQTGRGTHVADLNKRPHLAFEGELNAIVANCADQLLSLGMTPAEAVQALATYLQVPIGHTVSETSGDMQTPKAS